MKTISKLFSIIGLAACTMTACDDNTSDVGFFPSDDKVNISQSTFNVLTGNIKVDSALANTPTCYLGKFTDPETGSALTSSFLAQYNLLEDYSLPDKSMMTKNQYGEVEADSCELRFYISSYLGDSLNSMKIGVYELDTAKVMKETEHYYTNIKPEDFLNNSESAIKKELSFSVIDLSISDSIRNLSGYNKNIRVKLPKEYGSYLLNSYYNHPEYYKNSFNFIRHVCPGFYVKTLSGNGTLVSIDVSALSVYFKYTLKDSTYNGVHRVAATEEVLQNNQMANEGLDKIINPNYTFMKVPSGIYTELTLPIDSIFMDEHSNDTINGASIVLPRYNNSQQSIYALSAPPTVMLLKKKELYSFFEEDKLADGVTSFITTYSSTNNSYTFSNIANLVSALRAERNKGAGITDGDSEETRKAKFAQWENENPEWNKVVVMPVNATYYTSGTSSTLTRVRNEMGMYSTKLVVGTNKGEIKMSVVYSSFNK